VAAAGTESTLTLRAITIETDDPLPHPIGVGRGGHPVKRTVGIAVPSFLKRIPEAHS
jgi:hypothetical protein